jgi:hypothetical protein
LVVGYAPATISLVAQFGRESSRKLDGYVPKITESYIRTSPASLYYMIGLFACILDLAFYCWLGVSIYFRLYCLYVNIVDGMV